jgi:hypothetical protein
MNQREPGQWEDVPPNTDPYRVILYTPDGDIEQTLLDDHRRRADCVVGAMAVSADPMDKRDETVPDEGYRVGFLLLVNREALAMNLEAKASPEVIAEVILNFHEAIRGMFGAQAVNEAGQILKARQHARREAFKAEMVSEAVEMLEGMLRKSQRNN